MVNSLSSCSHVEVGRALVLPQSPPLGIDTPACTAHNVDKSPSSVRGGTLAKLCSQIKDQSEDKHAIIYDPAPTALPELRPPRFPNLLWERSQTPKSGKFPEAISKKAPVDASKLQANVETLVFPPLPPASIRATMTKKPCALYLFAGVQRQSDIAACLRRMGWEVTELDIIAGHDLSRKTAQDKWRQLISSNCFQALISSPPCDTFTRVQWANDYGPRPLRSFLHKEGFPWLVGDRKHRAHIGTILGHFNFECIQLQASQKPGFVFMEFPEDLGAIRGGKHHGQRPASLWQWPAMHSLRADLRFTELGILQSDFSANYLKPIRLLVKGHLSPHIGLFLGPPRYDPEGFYLGPIPQRSAKDLGLTTLARKAGETTFRTSGTAAWPADLCRWAADCLHTSWLEFCDFR